MFVSTYDESRVQGIRRHDEDASSPTSTTDVSVFSFPPTPTGPVVHDVNERPPITEVTGAWAAIADEAALATVSGMEELKLHVHGKVSALPANFKGLATPELNPMVRVL